MREQALCIRLIYLRLKECPGASECEKLSDIIIYVFVDKPRLFVTATFQDALLQNSLCYNINEDLAEIKLQ